jgi:hypothetical protein
MCRGTRSRRCARARIRVDLLGARTGADLIEAGDLGIEADRIGLFQPVWQRARGERARAVRAVAVDRATGVDHDRLIGLDRSLAGHGVWAGAVRSRSHDQREGDVVGSLLAQEPLQLPGEFALRSADERLLCQARSVSYPA